MNIKIYENPTELGEAAAQYCASILHQTIQEKGEAVIILSTGSSQFEFMQSFVEMDIDWGKITMFHLDEYVALPESHPASFRKYLKERFLQFVSIKEAFLVNSEGDVAAHLQKLNKELGSRTVDLALIGIGENAHIAFNDPPADFDTDEIYKIAALDDACKQQQVGEGWFASLDDVPTHAITMTVKQIMKSKHIVSVVPHQVKAKAVKLTLEHQLSNMVPSTMLREHPRCTLFLDNGSASLLNDVKV
ncbi:glucosamine-6-phosphate deaminase [Paenibacillus sp. GXUN7292]|uniref:glucosamine-6-phosphate deaminase n=1 Tax=Paenibacillus sp. GXUN7292 TaxID=3422499 RepID=UPI003D7C5A7C